MTSSTASRCTLSGTIERHAVGDATPAVVPDDSEARKPQHRHEPHHVARHRGLAIGRVGGMGRRLAARSVAAQVGAHDGEVGGERRRDPVPHHMGLRKAVQQQNGLATAAAARKDRGIADVRDNWFEAFEHGASLSHPTSTHAAPQLFRKSCAAQPSEIPPHLDPKRAGAAADLRLDRPAQHAGLEQRAVRPAACSIPSLTASSAP